MSEGERTFLLFPFQYYFGYGLMAMVCFSQLHDNVMWK